MINSMASKENVSPLGTSHAETTTAAEETVLQDIIGDTVDATPLKDEADAEVDNSPIAVAWKKPEISEHPEGAEIRRQVEWYFSDENLPTDSHLLELCGGHKNEPVSISHILGWKKMRRFRPKLQVIEALKKSAFLEVVDGKRIRRRVALIEDNDASIITGKLTTVSLDVEGDKERSSDADERNSSRQPSVQRGTGLYVASKKPPKGTGFEEYYTEGPVTPAEYEEEQDIYNIENPISERIEIAIQRYKLRRKFTVDASRYFDQWLRFGGIETAQRQFTGMGKLGKKELKEMHPADQAKAVATHHVGDDKEEYQKWELDFVGVAEGFLSSYFPETTFDYTNTEVQLVCKVMTNFYNYLLLHNVLPEPYVHETILAARYLVAEQAPRELNAVKVVSILLPGPFNRSCSYLFGGKESTYINSSWGFHQREDDEKIQGPEGARVTVITGVAAMGSDKLFHFVSSGADIQAVDDETKKQKHAWTEAVKCVQELAMGLEVVSISMPTAEANGVYTRTLNSKVPMHPLGVLVCKPWRAEDSVDQYDLPAGCEPGNRGSLPETLEFWLEMPILRAAFVGMKLVADIRKLDFGGCGEIWVIDGVTRVFCSFYKYLLNELMPKPLKEVKWFPIGGEAEEEDAEAAKESISDG